jgi:hypothetical protein
MRRLLVATLGVALFASMAVAAPDMATRGQGVIRVSNATIALFQFRVWAHEGEVRGNLSFYEIAPSAWGPRLVNVVRMRATGLECGGDEARFGGPGRLNHRPVNVEVGVVDARHPGDPNDTPPDLLRVRAIGPDGNVVYAAGGPVVLGDLVVRCGPPGA